jgi:hypothetical protein
VGRIVALRLESSLFSDVSPGIVAIDKHNWRRHRYEIEVTFNFISLEEVGETTPEPEHSSSDNLHFTYSGNCNIALSPRCIDASMKS